MGIILLLLALLGIPAALARQALRIADQYRLQAKLWITFLVIAPFTIYLAGQIYFAYTAWQLFSPLAGIWTALFVVGLLTAFWFKGGRPADLILAIHFTLRSRTTTPTPGTVQHNAWYRAGSWLGRLTKDVADRIFDYFCRALILIIFFGLFFAVIPVNTSLGMFIWFALAFAGYVISSGKPWNWPLFNRVFTYLMLITVTGMILQAIFQTAFPGWAAIGTSSWQDNVGAPVYYVTNKTTYFRHCDSCTGTTADASNTGSLVEMPTGEWVMLANQSDKLQKIQGVRMARVYLARDRDPRQGFSPDHTYLAIWEDLTAKREFGESVLDQPKLRCETSMTYDRNHPGDKIFEVSPACPAGYELEIYDEHRPATLVIEVLDANWKVLDVQPTILPITRGGEIRAEDRTFHITSPAKWVTPAQGLQRLRVARID